ncbi:hypothetical protein APUTEX25_002199 [Auxenochlorella protothecoides]|uniref:mRNA export factor GLE1 n=1 Tax=Auxenochlorella protothecoides TaxID=3075 RepID=A0A3M7KVP1_AUXPR|nr:hypothetical protein APUTEX25_002199 [Auxenochlorella protothecoides]|eukprot:RMZ54613.1 hypothetical protein APUTEX25_002199 [Auxenochlorella protothecoides]
MRSKPAPFPRQQDSRARDRWPCAALSPQLRAATQLGRLDAALGRLEVQEASVAQELARHAAADAAREAEGEAARRRERASSRARLLSSLRVGHAAAAETAAEQLAAAAEAAARARQAAAEEERRIRAEKDAAAAAQRASEAARLAAAAAAAREEEARAAQERQRQAAAKEGEHAQRGSVNQGDASASAAALRPAAPPALPESAVHATPGALECKRHLEALLAEAKALAAPYKADPGTKAARRAVDKALTLGVQQVSASREQVSRLSLRLGALMAEQGPGPASAYAQLALAAKICVQCEVQVTRLPGFAFPLAEVAVAVAAGQPAFAELLIAQLVAACPLCLPMVYGRDGAGAGEEAWLRLSGYKVRTDEDSGQTTRESTDEYMLRVGGFVRLYAAFTQCDAANNPHGLKKAWTWLARFLNAVPADRASATALIAFLQVAAYRLHRAYRGQALKLFEVVHRDYLARLNACEDPDARANFTRIKTFLEERAYLAEPEGRALPKFDTSSIDRA